MCFIYASSCKRDIKLNEAFYVGRVQAWERSRLVVNKRRPQTGGEAVTGGVRSSVVSRWSLCFHGGTPLVDGVRGQTANLLHPVSSCFVDKQAR